MKKALFSICIFSLWLLMACSSARTKTGSAIGLVPLPEYKTTNIALRADTVYQVIQDEPSFRGSFTAPATAKRPDFGGQTVVAILLRQLPTEALRFTKAEIRGKTINVYAQNCSRDTDSSCEKSTTVLATIPKVSNARSVHFFVNGQRKEAVSW